MSQSPISHRDQIKALALDVNDALSSYTGVHDAIFRDAGTFRSFLKTLIGRGVPMSSLLQQAEGLVPVHCSSELRSFIGRATRSSQMRSAATSTSCRATLTRSETPSAPWSNGNAS